VRWDGWRQARAGFSVQAPTRARRHPSPALARFAAGPCTSRCTRRGSGGALRGRLNTEARAGYRRDLSAT